MATNMKAFGRNSLRWLPVVGERRLRQSLRWGLRISAVLLWTAASAYGQLQVGPGHVMLPRGASLATSATATVPTQTNMVYHGGPVLANSTTYAFWWGNPADFPADTVAGVEQFLGGLNGSSFLSLADQYMLGAKTTTRFGGSFYDSSAPPSSLTGTSAHAAGEYDLDIARHLYDFLLAKGVTPDPKGIYFIFTSNFPPNEDFFCAFHDYLFLITPTGTTPLFQFAWVGNSTGNYQCLVEGDVFFGDPYLAANNYSAGTQAMVNIASHEFMETITDPQSDGWYAGSKFVEIGDACAYVFQNWVQLTNSSRWKIQEEWSNQVNGCVQGYGTPVELLGAASVSRTVTSFNIPGATYGIFGNGINDRGAIVGDYYNANFFQPAAAFVRDPLGNITTFNVPAATIGTGASGINSEGAVAGSYADANGSHGFVRDPLGSFTTFDVFASALSNNTLARAINAAGAITGRYEEVGSMALHGFVRDPLGNITTFDAPGKPYQTIPTAINDNGAITGVYANLNQPSHSFVSDPLGNITTFDVPDGVNGTKALSINLQGAIAGTYTDSNFVKHGFVRDPDGNFTTFDAPGAMFGTVADNINNLGVVAGYYSDAKGISHGFVRDPYGNFTILSEIPRGINDYGMTTGYQAVAVK